MPIDDQVPPSDQSSPLTLRPFDGSPTIGKIASALAKAQAKFTPIVKDKTAKIELRGSDSRSFSYEYADLPKVLEAVLPALTDQGIAVFQPINIVSGGVAVTTVLACGEEWLSCTVVMPCAERNDPRKVASAATYARRYGLTAMTGVAAQEDDDDAEAARAPAPRRQPRAEPPARPERRPEPDAGQATDAQPITAAQIERLKMAIDSAGKDRKLIQAYLKETYGYMKWSEIRRAHYDQIVDLVEAAPPPTSDTTTA